MFLDLRDLMKKNIDSNKIGGKANPALFGKPTGQTTLAKFKGDIMKSTSLSATEERSFHQVKPKISTYC